MTQEIPGASNSVLAFLPGPEQQRDLRFGCLCLAEGPGGELRATGALGNGEKQPVVWLRFW